MGRAPTMDRGRVGGMEELCVRKGLMQRHLSQVLQETPDSERWRWGGKAFQAWAAASYKGAEMENSTKFILWASQVGQRPFGEGWSESRGSLNAILALLLIDHYPHQDRGLFVLYHVLSFWICEMGPQIFAEMKTEWPHYTTGMVLFPFPPLLGTHMCKDRVGSTARES